MTLKRYGEETKNKQAVKMQKLVSRGPMGGVRNICVYCGSGAGGKPMYAEAARTLGHSLAQEGIGLVYGGGSLGLMGEVARATLEAGGRVTGIIPAFLSEREQMLRDVD